MTESRKSLPSSPLRRHQQTEDQLWTSLLAVHRDSILCSACSTNAADILVLDCKHISVCHACVGKCLRCPQCNNAYISQALRITPVRTNVRDLMLQETQDLWLQISCVLCHQRKRQIMFLNCHHVLVCSQCSTGLTECPVCYSEISDVKRIFF